MNIDDELKKESDKIENEKIIGETLIQNTKKKYAEYLINDIGDELKKCNQYTCNTSYKLPFKIRFKNFINKIKNIF